jgi:hypothetical protein
LILSLLLQAAASPAPSPSPHITWVKFEKPTFDLVGVVLSSLGLAGLCAVTALGLGVLWGLAIILRRRHRAPVSWADGSLRLLDARRP